MVYDSKNVNVTVKGALLTGFGSGSFVSCAKNAPNIVPYVGVKGETAESIVNDNTGTVTVTLQHTSPSNKLLSDLANRRESFGISVTDINEGGFVAGGNDAKIVTTATNERSGEIGDRAWEIYVADYSDVAR
ncbi:MAG: DUF3277 family protein [Clostridiales bacterium]|jgi:hypothetical protein|nr:DUF3277 family protein [Clostridiales bacterium]